MTVTIEELHNVAFMKIDMRITTDLEMALHETSDISDLKTKSEMFLNAKDIYIKSGDYFGFKDVMKYDIIDEADLETFAALSFISYMNTNVKEHKLSDVEIQNNVRKEIFNYVIGDAISVKDITNSPFELKTIKRITQFSINMLIKNYNNLVKDALNNQDINEIEHLQNGIFGKNLQDLLRLVKENKDVDLLGLNDKDILHPVDSTKINHNVYEKLATDAITTALNSYNPISNQNDFLELVKKSNLNSINDYQDDINELKSINKQK